MEKIAHIWNVNQIMTKLKCPQSRNLQTFYIRCCKKLSQGSGLPKQQFGPSAMCVHCNSLWNTVDHQIRILPGRSMSKSVEKIVAQMQNKDKRVPRVRSSLGRKAIRRRTNRLSIKCLVCFNVTKLSLAKPKREKVKEEDDRKTDVIQKRKKKKVKDKTAGLKIPMEVGKEQMLETNRFEETGVNKSQYAPKTVTGVQKLKKLNIHRLKDIVTRGVTPPKSKSLHSFLSEL